MAIGFIGRKCGMTRVFCEDGTVSSSYSYRSCSQIELFRLKLIDNDGYRAIQVTTGAKKLQS